MNIIIWLKLIGCICIIWGASGYGVWLSAQYGARLKLLEQLRQMMFLLKGQIVYANAPLDEAFETIAARMEGALPTLFAQVAARIGEQGGESFYEMWKETVTECTGEIPLTESDRQALVALGEHLGFLDRDMQERNLLLYLEQLDLDIGYLRAHKEERSRLYTCLGVMGGLFLAVLLC